MKRYLKKFKGLIILNVFLILIVALMEALQALLFKLIIDNATGTTKYSFYYVIAISLAFLIFLFITEFSTTSVGAKLNANIMKLIKEDIFKTILFYKVNFNSERNSEIMSLLTNDIKTIETDYIGSIALLLKHITMFIAALVILAYINIWLVISIFTLGWIPLLIPRLFNKQNQKLKMIYSDSNVKFIERIKETLYGFEVIKTFRIENSSFDSLNKENISLEDSKFKYKSFEGIVDALTDTNGLFIFLFNMIIAGYFTSKHSMTVGTMIASVQLMNYIINPLVGISKTRTKIKSVKLIVNKVTDLISSRTQYIGSNFDEDISAVKFSNVSFSYALENKVIDNFNYTFEKGKKYAIVGPSGSGKSTLIKILMKYYENYEGSISINNSLLKDINTLEWLDKISIIHQNVFLFNATILENLCLGNNFSDDNIENAIKMSGLGNVISKLENGINELTGDNGSKLSGGQKQRIAIARALLKDSQILVIDEATASLDNIISREIEETILDLDKTVIIITHKYDETIMQRLDNIIVLNEGKIAEIGKFDELKQNKGLFSNLYNSQNLFENKTIDYINDYSTAVGE